MFTGIVENVGTIVAVASRPGGARLRVRTGAMARDCALGASVSISGVCLTVCERSDDSLSFDVIKETLDRSALGSKRPGQPVNLERSLRAGDRIDGHFVQGHVDGTAAVAAIRATDEEHVVWLRPDVALRRYLVPKGSVAVDGVSLTIAELRNDTFSVALIPTTLERTTLANLRVNEQVNIETDVITRTVVHHLSQLAPSGNLSREVLKEAGFA